MSIDSSRDLYKRQLMIEKLLTMGNKRKLRKYKARRRRNKSKNPKKKKLLCQMNLGGQIIIQKLLREMNILSNRIAMLKDRYFLEMKRVSFKT